MHLHPAVCHRLAEKSEVKTAPLHFDQITKMIPYIRQLLLFHIISHKNSGAIHPVL